MVPCGVLPPGLVQYVSQTRLTKAWTAIDRLSIIWKSDLTNKMKRSFFQAEVVSILLYGCTTWTLTKRLEKKLDGNYTRMLRKKKEKDDNLLTLKLIALGICLIMDIGWLELTLMYDGIALVLLNGL